MIKLHSLNYFLFFVASFMLLALCYEYRLEELETIHTLNQRVIHLKANEAMGRQE